MTANRSGDVAFFDGLRLYLAGAGAPARAVIRSGDTLEVAPGDLRTVSSVTLSSTETSPSPFMLNDRGQVSFRANFSDGSSGIFVATPTQPVPTLAPLAHVGAVLLLPLAAWWVRRSRLRARSAGAAA